MRKFDDITPPSRRPNFEMPSTAQAEPNREVPRQMQPRQTSGFPYRTVGIAVVIIAGAIGALFYFSKAEVDIVPATAAITVSGSYTATANSGELPFQVVSAQKVAMQSVQGTGTKTVNQAASGTITIYNTQSKVQQLVANTRFASKSGLIFRIHSAVAVPAGSTSAPGTVTATVYADKDGESYNIDPTSFTLPGLSGSAQYSQVYAKSSSPMTGGLVGTVPNVSATTENTTRTALVAALAPDLTNALMAEVPSGYILVPGAATTTYTALTSAPSATTGMVDVKEQGTITAVVFPATALAQAVARQTLGPTYSQGSVTFDPSSKFSLLSSTMPSSDLQAYPFALSGNATLVYTVDPNRIAAAIAGKSRDSAEVTLTNFPEVKQAVLTLRPFWRQSFPEDPTSISVVVLQP